jgi:hypothetical protein
MTIRRICRHHRPTPRHCAHNTDCMIEELTKRAQELGVAVRGAFHPDPEELWPQLSSTPIGTIVLLGFTGGTQWPVFARSAEASDGQPNPLDRWSRRVIGALSREWGGRDFYPNDVPFPPFQQFAKRCEPVYASPIGLLIHAHWGLWHAYRGGLLFGERMNLSEPQVSRSPCDSCQTRPCLNACPVGAFASGSFDFKACMSHVSSATGSDCRELGCRARRACPVATPFSYPPQQARFHMNAFIGSKLIED